MPQRKALSTRFFVDARGPASARIAAFSEQQTSTQPHRYQIQLHHVCYACLSSRAFHASMVHNLLVGIAHRGLAHGSTCRSIMAAGACLSSRALHTNMVYKLVIVAARSGLAHGIACRSIMAAGVVFPPGHSTQTWSTTFSSSLHVVVLHTVILAEGSWLQVLVLPAGHAFLVIPSGYLTGCQWFNPGCLRVCTI